MADHIIDAAMPGARHDGCGGRAGRAQLLTGIRLAPVA
jgi:hypothetical protein